MVLCLKLSYNYYVAKIVLSCSLWLLSWVEGIIIAEKHTVKLIVRVYKMLVLRCLGGGATVLLALLF